MMFSQERFFSSPYEAPQKTTDTTSQNCEILLNKGKQLIKSRQFEDASNCFLEILKLDPDHKQAKQQQIEVCNVLGKSYLDTGQYKEAIDCYTTITQFNSSDIEAWAILGRLFYTMQFYQSAIKNFTHYIDTNKKNEAIYYLLASSFFHLGDYLYAYHYFFIAGTLKPNFWEAWVGAKNALEEIHDVIQDKQWQAWYQLQENKGTKKPQEFSQWYQLQETICTQKIQDFAKNSSLFNELGLEAYNNKDYRSSYLYFLYASEIEPNKVTYLYNKKQALKALLNLFNLPEFLILLENNQCLGRGGEGTVYQGTYSNQGKLEPIAIKKMLTNSKESKDYAREEAALMCKLEHRNIIKFIGITHIQKSIIIEFAANGALSDYLSKHGPTLPAKQKWAIALEIARGIRYLHNQQIIHRDIKSPNILLDKNLSAKIADFATAHFNPFGTVKNGLVGTRAWWAPELFISGEYSNASDIFAFGVVLWELMTAKRPYENLDIVAIKANIVGEKRETIPENIAPPEIIDLTEKCWAHEKTKRPSAITAVRILSFFKPIVPPPKPDGDLNLAKLDVATH